LLKPTRAGQNILQHLLFVLFHFFSLLLYKKYTDKDVNEAIDTCGLREFVNNLSDGLNAILYDNGKNVSGGERSRLVIVRDLYDRVLTVKKNIF